MCRQQQRALNVHETAMSGRHCLEAADDNTIGGGTANAFLLQCLDQVSLRVAGGRFGEVLLGGCPSNLNWVPFLQGGHCKVTSESD